MLLNYPAANINKIEMNNDKAIIYIYRVLTTYTNSLKLPLLKQRLTLKSTQLPKQHMKLLADSNIFLCFKLVRR